MSGPLVLSILSLEIADRCELHLARRSSESVLIILTDGRQSCQGEMGAIGPLWEVLNGGKAAARSGRMLLGIAREGSEIDVVAIQRGVGVILASRFSVASFADLLERADLPLRAATTAPVPSPSPKPLA